MGAENGYSLAPDECGGGLSHVVRILVAGVVLILVEARRDTCSNLRSRHHLRSALREIVRGIVAGDGEDWLAWGSGPHQKLQVTQRNLFDVLHRAILEEREDNGTDTAVP